MDKLSSFQDLLQLWTRKIESDHLAMFSNLSSFVEENNDATVLDETVKNLIISHLEALHTEFTRYFPEITSLDLTLVSNPFVATIEQCVFLMVKM